MKKLFTLVLVAVTLTGAAQKGKTFPLTVGATLENKGTSLPQKNGKYSIVAVAFSKAAEGDLKKWLNPLYNTFMVKATGKGAELANNYDVNFTFVPVIGGVKKIMEEFKATTDKAFWPYVMDTEKTDMKDTELILEVKDRKIPYIFVLDKNGIVLEYQTGEFNEAKIDALEEAIE